MTRSGADFFACRRVNQGGSAARVSHLLVADDALRAGSWGSSQVAVCGVEVVHPGGPIAGETDEDPGYCPVCVRAAVRWNIRRTGR